LYIQELIFHSKQLSNYNLEMEFKIEEKYSLEYLLEMLGGYKYCSKNQIYYVYHDLNGNEKEAKHFLKLCEEENQPINKASEKLQTKE